MELSRGAVATTVLMHAISSKFGNGPIADHLLATPHDAGYFPRSVTAGLKMLDCLLPQRRMLWIPRLLQVVFTDLMLGHKGFEFSRAPHAASLAGALSFRGFGGTQTRK